VRSCACQHNLLEPLTPEKYAPWQADIKAGKMGPDDKPSDLGLSTSGSEADEPGERAWTAINSMPHRCRRRQLGAKQLFLGRAGPASRPVRRRGRRPPAPGAGAAAAQRPPEGAPLTGRMTPSAERRKRLTPAPSSGYG
jgi:hypothetical protein